MSIERLNKAASAAGYAMATPDDDAPLDVATERETQTVPARAMVVADTSARLISPETVTTVTTWLKGHLPGFGGRQPA